MKKAVVFSPDAPKAIGPYSQALSFGELVFCSGQLGVDTATGKLAQGVEKINDVTWFELGMPEAIWDLQAKEFGPLVVGMDTHGGSIYASLKQAAFEKIDALYPA